MSILLASAIALSAGRVITASESSAADEGGGGTVIVTGMREPTGTTGSKTDTPLRDIPTAVSVVSKDVLDQQDVRGLDAALTNASAVAPLFGGGYGIADNYVIRGLPMRFLRNGLPDGSTFNGYKRTLADVAAIEVLKGPGSAVHGRIDGDDGLDRWARQHLRLTVRSQPPKVQASGPTVGTSTFLGRPVAVPVTWVRVFSLAGSRVSVSYVKGANVVTARREDVGFLNVIKNLHKGVGLPVAWVLLMDTIAGAIITMALTGFLLWSRLHGPRLLAGAIAGGSLVWAMAALAGNL